MLAAILFYIKNIELYAESHIINQVDTYLQVATELSITSFPHINDLTYINNVSSSGSHVLSCISRVFVSPSRLIVYIATLLITWRQLAQSNVTPRTTISVVYAFSVSASSTSYWQHSYKHIFSLFLFLLD